MEILLQFYSLTTFRFIVGILVALALADFIFGNGDAKLKIPHRNTQNFCRVLYVACAFMLGVVVFFDIDFGEMIIIAPWVTKAVVWLLLVYLMRWLMRIIIWAMTLVIIILMIPVRIMKWMFNWK